MRTLATCLTSIVILAAAVLPAQAAISPDAVIPVVGTTAGGSGANFRTEAQLHNPTSSTIRGKLVFVWQGIPIQPNPTAELDYQLAPRQTMVYEDLVAAMGGNGLGSIDVFAEEGPVPDIIVRAFDDKGANGTTGLMVPVLGPDRFLGTGMKALLVVPSDLERYRMNIGVRTLVSDDPAARVRIQVFDASGQATGDAFIKDFQATFFAQAPAADFLGQPLLAGSSIVIEVLEGRLVIYSTTTDNVTNDGSIQIDRLFNLPPTIDDLNIQLTTPAATPVTVPIMAGDPDDDPVTASVGVEPGHGRVEITAPENGAFDVTYTPDGGFTGDDGFTTVFDDGNGGRTTVSITVKVEGSNGSPIALGNSYAVIEGGTLTVPAPGVLGNDQDPDGDPLTAALETGPQQAATFTLGTDGSVSYTPKTGFTGTDTFTYRASDGTSTSNLATVRIAVSSSNTPPTASPDAASTDEDTPITISVLANDTDAESPGSLAIDSVNATGTLGSVSIAGTQVSYDPTTSATLQALAAGASATDTFQYTIRDPEGLTASASVTVTVSGVDDLPTVTDDTATVLEDAGATAIDVLANDNDPDGGTAITGVTQGTSGTVVITGGGTGLTYQPNVDACGADSFTYTVTGGGTGTVSVTVTCVNDAPSFTKGGDQTVLEDAGAQSVLAWATGISAGPANETGQVLTFNVTGNTNPALFSAGPAVSAGGNLTYTPATNANGTATITIALSDSGGTANGGVDTSGAQSFVINVTAVNDAPSFTKGSDQSVNENSGAQTVNGWATAISAGPADESGQTLAFNVTGNTNPALFSAGPAISAAGELTYTPATNANGSATITITLQDNGGTANGGVDTSTAQTFAISVVGVNSAPSFTKGADQTVNEDAGAQTVNGWATAISPGPGEAGQVLTFNVTGNTNASLFSAGPAIDATTGDLTYTPAANANGTATITITLSDDGGTANGGQDTSAPQTFVITVNAVNDVPSFTKGADQTVLEDAVAQTVTNWATAISAGPADESGQTLTFNVTGNTNPGLFSAGPAISSTGTLTYTPATNANGTATITITLQDNGGTANGGVDTSASQTFVINVTAVNDVPSFTKGANQSVGDNAGAQSVANWATAISPGPANESAQTLTFNVTGNTNPTIFAVAPAISSTGTLTYTPAIVTGTQVATITITLQDNGGTANGGVDTSAAQTFTISVTHVNLPPSPIASPKESFDTIGNTAFEFKGTQALTPSVFVSGNLLANFTDSDGPNALSMTTTGSSATTNGGTVTIGSNGEFTFIPAAGDTAASDTFQYGVTDGAATVTRTVTINRQGRVWYVQNNATAGGLGRSTDPFDTLQEAETASVAGDTIYVYAGNGTNSGQNVGITLKANQRLLGSGVALTVPVAVNGGGNPTTLLSAGSQPVMGNVGGNGVSVTDIGGVEIRGLNISGSANAIDVTTTAANGGGATITNNTIGGAGAEGIDVNADGSGAMALVITNNAWSSGGTHTGNAIDIARTAGTATLDLSSNTGILSNAIGVRISGGSAASFTVTGFANNTVSGDTGGNGMLILAVTFDAVAGGAVDQVAGGTTTVGGAGNPVGAVGAFFGSVSGSLSFADLAVHGTTSGLVASGSGMSFGVQNSSSGSVITSVNGAALDLNGLAAAATFNSVTTGTSGSSGVSLVTVTGTISIAAGSLGDATSATFNISGGTANVTYNGTITDTTGTAVSVANTTGGTKAFGGAITGGLVSLTTNTGATINFTGGLTLSTGTNPAFTATGGGTVSVTGSTNTLTTTTGTALNVANTTIGASGLTFRSISSNGAANGIALNNTGTNAGLTVTGTGAAGSGGTIQNSTGAGVSLTTTRDVSLTSMNVQNGGADGISGSSVTNFSLTSCTVSSNGNAAGENGIEFTGLLGTASISSSTITGSADNNLRVENSSGTLTGLTISNSTFSNTSAATGNDGILVLGNSSANMTISVTGSTFTNNRGDHFQASTDALSSGAIDLTFQNNDLNGAVGNLGAGITLSSSGTSTMTFDILNNGTSLDPFVGAVSSAITINAASDATMSGTISGNVIGNPAVTDSGSSQGDGITVAANNTSDITVAITGNSIREYSNLAGINIHVRDGATGSIQATVTGNTISDPGTFGFNGILAQAGAVATDAGFLCLDIGGAAGLANSIAGSGANGGDDFRVRQRNNTTVRLPGYGGANNDNAAVVAFIQGRNTGTETGSATNNVAGGGGGFVGGAACMQP